MNDAVEGIEHHAITGLIKRQLHAQGPVDTLQIESMSLRHHDYHAVAFGIRHGTSERKIVYQRHLPILDHRLGDTEKHYRLAILKVVLYILVLRPEYLYRHLVERIVMALPHQHGIPSIAAFHLAPDAHGLRLFAEGLLLRLIFQLQQQALSLQ